MFINFNQAVEYLYRNLPMFQRIGPPALKIDLTNTIKLCNVLGNPQQEFKSIHIAGTNGKGSTAHLLASVLQSSGYRTGLYTSPHLKSFTERIRVNGLEVENAFVVDFVNSMLPVIEEVRPSFFEITVAMAFSYFASRTVDVAVVEVGLGGRLDSTNIIHPELSLITNIGMDHVELLGKTLEKIAWEKAGIIKERVPVVISERQTGVSKIFIEVAKERNAELFFAEEAFSAIRSEHGFTIQNKGGVFLRDVNIGLDGNYQERNVLGVMQAVELLRQQGLTISDDSLRHGLAHVVDQTGLKGRWQKLRERPLVYCDTAHNSEGMAYVIRQIKECGYDSLHMVLGVTKDKDIDNVMSLLPKDARYYFCQARIPRALDADVLARKGEEWGLAGLVVRDVNEAIALAVEKASPRDFVFVGGSTFVVAEIENL